MQEWEDDFQINNFQESEEEVDLLDMISTVSDSTK